MPVLRDVSFAIRRRRGARRDRRIRLGQEHAGARARRPAAGRRRRRSGSTAQPLPPAPAAAHASEQLRRIQIVFQMADTALNPAHSVERILGRPLAFYHRPAPAPPRARRVAAAARHGAPARRPWPTACPRDLSGGQKQRVNLARALAAEPALLICDEVTSALDTVVGAAVLDLLAELRRELGVAMVFISHDLATVRAIADEVMVMYAGRAVRNGRRRARWRRRRAHPYADLLAASVPELRPGWLDGLAAAPGTERGARRRAGRRRRRPAPSSPAATCASRAPAIPLPTPPTPARQGRRHPVLPHRGRTAGPPDSGPCRRESPMQPPPED